MANYDVIYSHSIEMTDLAVTYIEKEEVEPREIEAFYSESGEYIVKVLLREGGPTVEATYESRYDSLTVEAVYYGVKERAAIRQGSRDNSPLKDFCIAYATL